MSMGFWDEQEDLARLSVRSLLERSTVLGGVDFEHKALPNLHIKKLPFHFRFLPLRARNIKYRSKSDYQNWTRTVPLGRKRNQITMPRVISSISWIFYYIFSLFLSLFSCEFPKDYRWKHETKSVYISNCFLQLVNFNHRSYNILIEFVNKHQLKYRRFLVNQSIFVAAAWKFWLTATAKGFFEKCQNIHHNLIKYLFIAFETEFMNDWDMRKLYKHRIPKIIKYTFIRSVFCQITTRYQADDWICFKPQTDEPKYFTALNDVSWRYFIIKCCLLKQKIISASCRVVTTNLWSSCALFSCFFVCKSWRR